VRDVSCSLHPKAPVRRYRTQGPNGNAVYPQCVPRDGSPPHLLAWDALGARRAPIAMEVRIANEEAAASRLTPSELGVLHAAASGLTVSESARRLGKSSETVKTQRRGIILKFGARNIAQVVGIATANGILTIGS
jgi:DNA-binding CsgD family transcriptional regulator